MPTKLVIFGLKQKHLTLPSRSTVSENKETERASGQSGQPANVQVGEEYNLH